MAQLDYKFSVIAEPAKRVRAYFLDADGSPSSNEQLRLGLEARDLVLQLHDERGKQASTMHLPRWMEGTAECGVDWGGLLHGCMV